MDKMVVKIVNLFPLAWAVGLGEKRSDKIGVVRLTRDYFLSTNLDYLLVGF